MENRLPRKTEAHFSQLHLSSAPKETFGMLVSMSLSIRVVVYAPRGTCKHTTHTQKFQQQKRGERDNNGEKDLKE